MKTLPLLWAYLMFRCLALVYDALAWGIGWFVAGLDEAVLCDGGMES